MSLINDGSVVPTLELMEEKLGKTYKIFQTVIDYLEEQYSDISTQWKHYGEKYGWTLKVFLKKRNLFFITPQDGFFNMSFVFGDKAFEKIKEAELPADIIESLVNAKKYAEGRGIKLEVKTRDELLTILTLLEIKIEN